jgi:thiosulfate/3-mercaptopyruvate sulfurtransferase
MAAPIDQDPTFAEYAHPESLVSTSWLAEHLDGPDLAVVECDEDVLLYDTGHIPGAVKLDWHTELNDAVTRDYVDPEKFALLCGERGIARETTVVFYGDRNNWWATYALWVFRLFGHPDVRILDGGRAKWIAEGRELTTEEPKPTPVEYPIVERDDIAIRAFKEDVLAHLERMKSGDGALVDVRSPGGPRRPHPRRRERPVGPGGERGRHLQVPRGAVRDLRGRAGPVEGRRGRGLLPDR